MSGRATRRGFLALLAGAPAALAAQQGAAPPPPRAGQGEVGELYDPSVVGRSRARTVAGDNEEAIKRLEQKLQCTCGCTLDIYTCRTTDFTCTFSPQLHREILAMWEAGQREEAITAAFVEKHGEKILMAPKPEGFNLAGYVVPGITIAAVGALVAWYIRRRIRQAAPVVPVPASPGTTAPAPAAPPGVEASPEELERLQRALQEIS